MEAGPQRIAQMLAELVELFKTEALHRLPVKSWMCGTLGRRIGS